MTLRGFNSEKTDYENPSLFLGETNGLFDTVNKRYPKIWSIYKTLKSQDWDENEFDFTSCNVDFKTCDKSTYDIMIKTLAWQWEADSVAAHSIAPIVAPLVSSDELWSAWVRVTDNEIVHAATYSEIVRNSFDDPKVILDEVLSVKESLARLEEVDKAMGHVKEISYKVGLGMIERTSDEAYDAAFLFTAVLFMLERVQFMSSFAVTFTIVDTGLFGPIGKAVQKIAQDELEIHVELDRLVLSNELNTERGRESFNRLRPVILKILNNIVNSEITWSKYLFTEGRQLVGLNSDMLCQWALFNAAPVYKFFALEGECEHTLPVKNPIKHMETWLDISKLQASPQEEDNNQYRVNVTVRDDEDEIFEM